MILRSPWIRSVLHKLGVDRAIGYSVLGQVGACLLQPVTLMMTLEFLTKEERGYYFTFANILGLQVFFDLGIGLAMQQAVSHESARLQWTDTGILAGDPEAKSRLASLWRLMLRWYTALAAIFAVVLLSVGWWLFSRHDDGTVVWRGPWLWAVAVTVTGMLLTPASMLMRGTGRVAEAARIGIAQSFSTSLTTWTALAAAGRLFSGAIGNTVGLMVQIGWIIAGWRPFYLDLHRQPRDGPAVDWWREIWPFQWKIALGWPFGYLVYYLFNPVLFASRGPEEAGQMGVSLAAATVLTTVSMSWINTKMPIFGQHIAKSDWNRLDDTFWAAFNRSTVLAILGSICATAFFIALNASGHRWAAKFLPPEFMAILFVNAVVNHVIFSVSAYVRAHRQEPFLTSVIVMGLAMGLMTISIGPRYGASGLAIGFLALNTIFMLRSVQIFRRCMAEWHAPAASACGIELPDNRDTC